VPKAPQQQAPVKPVIKGALPVPRNIFRKRGQDKSSDAYIARATPSPKHPIEANNPWLAYKRRLAEIRKSNLRDGLKGLEERKIHQDGVVAGRSKQKRRLREQLVNAPQREDERLTSPTILAANRTVTTGILPDPDREARVAAKAARVQAKQQALEDARKDALHTLYMNARNFITTEAQLEKKIEEIFVPDPHAPNNLNQNIWDFGTPPTIETMMNSLGDRHSNAIKYGSGPAATSLKRMKKIAEELTGGKMEDRA
jgi:hypothetical protein